MKILSATPSLSLTNYGDCNAKRLNFSPKTTTSMAVARSIRLKRRKASSSVTSMTALLLRNKTLPSALVVPENHQVVDTSSSTCEPCTHNQMDLGDNVNMDRLSDTTMSSPSSSSSSLSSSSAKKMVSFDLTETRTYVIQYKPWSVRRRWYMHSDYERFREHVQASVRFVNRNESYRSYRGVINYMYSTCCHESTGSIRIPTSCQMVQDIFQKQILDHLEVLGIEKHSIKNLALDKPLRRRNLYDFVLQSQQQQQQQHQVKEDYNPAPEYSLDEVLRQGCEAVSQPHTLYARIMAQAIAEDVSM